MQLLALGRSLGKIGDQPSRYKMTQQSLLPKFGPIKGLENVAVTGEGRTKPAFQNAPVKPAPEPQNAKPTKPAKEKTTMNVVPSTPLEATATAGTVSRQAFPLGRWTLFKNPFSKASRPKPTETPVQAELSLDTVRPVRNDLNDSDLEVVPLANETSAVMPEGPAWNRFKTQLVRAGKA